MSFTRRLLRNRHAVWALAIAVAVFGTRAYFDLPMQLFPDTEPPTVNVLTARPGASAVDIADTVSRPLEEELAAVEGVVEVRSTSQDDLSLVTVELDYDVPSDMAAVDVQNAIARIRGELPADIREPRVLELDTAQRPVITFGVRGEDLQRARRLAEDRFAPRLMREPGVAAVDVFGGSEPALLVEVRRDDMDAYGLGLAQVARALETHDVSAPAGRIRGERQQITLRLDDRATDPDAIARIPLRAADGTPLRLGDVAETRIGSLDDDARFAIDGERAIALQVFKASDANTVDTVARARRALEEIRADHPALTFVEGEEEASFTETSVENLLANVWQALALAGAIVFLFLGRVRRSMVAILSMPMAYAATFALMSWSGVELNMVTLSAIILAVGMVVDASVVVLENISRKHDEGETDVERAAVEGTDEVRLAVVAGVGTTVTVLIPLLFLQGFVGAVFRPLALTLLYAFVSSVVVALVLVPVASLYGHGQGRVDRWSRRITDPFQHAMEQVRRGYLFLLRHALRWRWITLLLALGVLGASVAGMRSLGREVLPRMDTGSFFVSLETPSGASLAHTESVVRHIEAVLGEQAEVTRVQSQVGFEAGMRSFGSTGAQGPTQGFISVTLTPRTERERTIWQIEEAVREGIARIPGIQTSTVRASGNTAKATTVAPIVVRAAGDDARVLDALGQEIVRRMDGVPDLVEPVRTWRIDQRRTEVEVDALRAGRLGLSPRAVASLMFAGSEGMPAGELHDDRGSPLPVRVRYVRSDAPQPDDLLAYPVSAGPRSAPVPLRSVATLEPRLGRAVVTRENLRPTLDVTASVGDRPLSFVVGDVQQALGDMTVPRGYQVEVTGEKDDLDESKGELLGALGAAVVAVYLLLVAQFRSFLHPLTVMLSVPLALAGVAAALAMAGKPVSMPVLVGLVLLVGIVVNNAIILVEFVRQRREAGLDRRQALEESVATRFRPIMMTSLSTIVGMIPLAAEWALGAERFSPLAIAVIGGMITATLLTMVVIPVVYDVLDSAAARLGAYGGAPSGHSV